MKILKKILSAKTFLFLQLLATVAFLFTMVRVQFLPMMYILVIAGVFLFLWLITLLLQLKARETSIRAILSRMLAVFLCVILVIGTVFVQSGYNAISGFTNADQETSIMSVIVLDESSYEKIGDLEGKKIGLNNQIDKENIVKAKNEVNEQVEATYKAVSDFGTLAEGLYDKSMDAIP